MKYKIISLCLVVMGLLFMPFYLFSQTVQPQLVFNENITAIATAWKENTNLIAGNYFSSSDIQSTNYTGNSSGTEAHVSGTVAFDGFNLGYLYSGSSVEVNYSDNSEIDAWKHLYAVQGSFRVDDFAVSLEYRNTSKHENYYEWDNAYFTETTVSDTSIGYGISYNFQWITAGLGINQVTRKYDDYQESGLSTDDSDRPEVNYKELYGGISIKFRNDQTGSFRAELSMKSNPKVEKTSGGETAVVAETSSSMLTLEWDAKMYFAGASFKKEEEKSKSLNSDLFNTKLYAGYHFTDGFSLGYCYSFSDYEVNAETTRKTQTHNMDAIWRF